MIAMSELFETAIVEKRNILNELRTTLHSLQELRFFTIYLSKINPYDKNTRVVRFPLSEFQRIMNFGKLNTAQLKATADSILKTKILLPKANGGFKGINIFEVFDVDQDSGGEWYVEINVTNAALPFLFDFKDRYFKYELWNALRLTAPSQIRMYELLKQYETIGRREIEVSKLQELLGVNYNRWDRFKAKVLDSCQKALKETTDICYTYERGKTGTGGKWLTIIFHISKNEDYTDQLTLFEFIGEGGGAAAEPPAQELLNDDIQIILDIYPQFTAAEVKAIYNRILKLQPDKGSTGTARVDYFKAVYDDTIRENEKKIRQGKQPIRDYAAYISKTLDNRIQAGEQL